MSSVIKACICFNNPNCSSIIVGSYMTFFHYIRIYMTKHSAVLSVWEGEGEGGSDEGGIRRGSDGGGGDPTMLLCASKLLGYYSE